MSDVMQLPGISPAAELLAEAIRKNYGRLRETETYSKQPAYIELWDQWNECKVYDWDGYGGLPVEHGTYQNAYCFIEALPFGYPLPSVGVEPDGQLTLEWYRHPRWTLSVSIGPDRTLHYAALFGPDDPRGTCQFSDEVPEILKFFIRRVALR